MARGLRSRVLASDDVVPLDDRRYSQPRLTFFHAPLHPDDFPLGTHKYVGTVGDLCRQGQSDIQFGTSIHILVDYEVQAPGRNVAGPAVLSPDNLLCGEANTYRECQVIPSSGPACCHYPHFVTPSVATSLRATPGMILVPTLCTTFFLLWQHT